MIDSTNKINNIDSYRSTHEKLPIVQNISKLNNSSLINDNHKKIK